MPHSIYYMENKSLLYTTFHVLYTDLDDLQEIVEVYVARSRVKISNVCAPFYILHKNILLYTTFYIIYKDLDDWEDVTEVDVARGGVQDPERICPIPYTI